MLHVTNKTLFAMLLTYSYSYLVTSITYVIFIFSAGGLSTYIHADHFRSRIPKDIPVNAMADAGYVS